MLRGRCLGGDVLFDWRTRKAALSGHPAARQAHNRPRPDHIISDPKLSR